ncbi:MAG: periplasmic heavy metal sensor [Deltaproteobacteria bacterium]|nr:periplasmic heavy metal sensor [Deltaproteobacteria bacterium]
MLKHFIIGIPLIVVLALAPLAMGQTMPSGKWWKDPEFIKELRLTSGDDKKLDKLFVKYRRRMIDLTNRVEKEQFEYQNLMEAPKLDEAAVNRQLQKLEEARTELYAEKNRFVVEVRKILGRDRFQKLVQIYSNSQ